MSEERIQHYLNSLDSWDEAAREELLSLASARLQQFARHMLNGFGLVRRHLDTDDLLQNALIRLWKTLETVRPETARHFLNLGALTIRRELIDLARHFGRQSGAGSGELSLPGDGADDTETAAPAANIRDPSDYVMWTEFHEKVEQLPVLERELINLVWYYGMTKERAAEVLGINVRTVYRRWTIAWQKLETAVDL